MAVVINGTSGITGNTGTLISASTIGVGGATPSASGAGITFPATQSASSDANTLDDYEEGTWTPTVNLLGTLTYSTQTGRYIKIGKQVFVQVYLLYSSSDSTQDGTVMSMGGFPFASASGATGTSCLMTERMYGTNSPTAPNIFHIGPSGSVSTSLNLYQNNYNGGITNASYFVSQVRSCYKGGSQYIYASFCYEASA
jgi:hypothetical protein